MAVGIPLSLREEKEIEAAYRKDLHDLYHIFFEDGNKIDAILAECDIPLSKPAVSRDVELGLRPPPIEPRPLPQCVVEYQSVYPGKFDGLANKIREKFQGT
jgi:hypothetical protein